MNPSMGAVGHHVHEIHEYHRCRETILKGNFTHEEYQPTVIFIFKVVFIFEVIFIFGVVFIFWALFAFGGIEENSSLKFFPLKYILFRIILMFTGQKRIPFLLDISNDFVKLIWMPNIFH